MEILRRNRKILLGMGIVFFLTGLVCYVEKNEGIDKEAGSLIRRKKGDGEYETELILEIDGTVQTELEIIVPEQRLTEEMESRYLSLAIEEIEKTFLKENRSLESVQDAVLIEEYYQEGQVLAEWKFSNPSIITVDGKINEEAMIEEAEEVMATVFLTCEDSHIVHEFCFVVCKQERTEWQMLNEKLNSLILESGEVEGEESLLLPKELEGHSLEWKRKKSKLPIQVFLLGLLVVVLLPSIEKERKNEQKEKRKEQLMREYPDMVNKLALLLGAGMTLQGAWKRIVTKYCEDCSKGQTIVHVVYEEMLITQREIDSGKGEIKAYESFGERCELQKYRKLSSYLVQNLKKGNKRLCNLLEQESIEAFEERRNMAQQIGEEVGTKLLFPMLLMLGIVIVIIMVPAILSFQGGIN